MKIGMDTSAYNEKRYGKPWIARVTFESAKGDFHFGEWVGQEGREGVLVIEAEPGDVIATGQKDFRKPQHSAPTFYILQDDGSLGPWVEKKEAYQHWQAMHMPQPAKAGQVEVSTEPEFDYEAVAWAYNKLRAFGMESSTEDSAHMMDRLKLMLGGY